VKNDDYCTQVCNSQKKRPAIFSGPLHISFGGKEYPNFTLGLAVLSIEL
jgi:hypothetical protein